MPRSPLRAIGSRPRSNRGVGPDAPGARRTGGAPGTSGAAARLVTIGRRRTFDEGRSGREPPSDWVTGSAPTVAPEDPPQADEHQDDQGDPDQRADDRGLDR